MKKPELPKNIKINHIVFPICRNEKILDAKEARGTIDYRNPEILLDETSPEIEAQTLLHEVMHGIEECYYIVKSKELEIEVRSAGMLCVLLESPGFLEYLIDVREYRKNILDTKKRK